MRVLTWNLFHGRAVPGAGRDLLDEFGARIEAWDWDVALLQEVPPWWPSELARRSGAQCRFTLTSRNLGLALRRAVAVRWPDLIKSNGGGSNVILVRSDFATVADHRVARLGRLPERRWLHAVRLRTAVWVGNLHTEAAAAQGLRAGVVLREWAGSDPAILGGDFNIADLELAGFERAGGLGVDQVFVRGLTAGATRVLERGSLSDHAPVLVEGIEKLPTPLLGPRAARTP